MIISGIISLQDEFGSIITCKKYSSKNKRDLIVSTWQSLYAVDKKPITINISPELDEKECVGIVELYVKDSIFQKKDYYSDEERNDIINAWKKKYKKFYIHIKPTQ